MFWSEIGSGFGEPDGTPLPKIPRSTFPWRGGGGGGGQLPYLKLSSRLACLRTRLICNFYIFLPDLLLNDDVVFNLIKSSYSIVKRHGQLMALYSVF